MLDGLKDWVSLSGSSLESTSLIYGGNEEQKRNSIKVLPLNKL
jgi:hypothetical protein